MTRRIDTKMSTAPAADNPESSPGAAANHNDHVSAQQRWFQRLALLRNVLSLQNEPAYPGLQKQRAAFWSVSYPHTPWLLHNLRLLPKHSATAVAATQTREPPHTHGRVRQTSQSGPHARVGQPNVDFKKISYWHVSVSTTGSLCNTFSPSAH